MSRLKSIKQSVKNWNLEFFGDLRLKEGDLNKRLGELDGLEGTSRWDGNFIEERKRIKRDLMELLMVKERSARLKARVQCAKDGDANSKFFHGRLSARKSRNYVTKIEKDNGEIVDSKEEIVNEIVAFFKNLYSSVNRDVIGFDGVDWRQIDESMADWLQRPFEEMEIKTAVFECDGNKAPGPDGFPLAVLPTQWEVLKED